MARNSGPARYAYWHGRTADRQRRRIFTAALNQAEELAVLRPDATYAVRPLLLFYSLSQAGLGHCGRPPKGQGGAESAWPQLHPRSDRHLDVDGLVPPGDQHARGAFQDVATATGSRDWRTPPNSVHSGPVTLTCSMCPYPMVVVSGRAHCRAIWEP